MKKIVLAYLLIIASLVPLVASAADGTINIAGSVTSSTCTINNGTNDFTVPLPSVSITALDADGKEAGKTPFQFALKNCPPNVKVRVMFEPNAMTNAKTGRIINSSSPGSAKNVEIKIGYPGGDDTYSIGSTTWKSYPTDASGTVTLTNYSASYVATGGAATAGSVFATLMYVLNFP